MQLIKKLDIFILKQFGMLFTGTFCISLFVLMMQFVWRYIDDLIGKGLSFDVLMQFFWYMGLMLVPQALPLAVLLSTLITFGNLGESSELTAIKASGISLMQAFRSIIVAAAMIAGWSFYMQNYVCSEANHRLWEVMMAIREKSPEVQIPEGIFYNGIPGCNLYVQKKDVKTGMLYGVMIYRMTESFEDAAIILADSGMLQSTEDKKHLILTLHSGEWFENMKSQELAGAANVPYRREGFVKKRIIMDYDDGLGDNSGLQYNDARGKGIKEIEEGLADIEHWRDSAGVAMRFDLDRQFYARNFSAKRDTVNGRQLAKAETLDFDSIFNKMSSQQKKATVSQAMGEVRMERDYLSFMTVNAGVYAQMEREHYMEMQNKFTTALIVIVFLFIGAPLGSIIRKGGLGVPVIISVLVFIVFYILDNTSFRMVRIGAWPTWMGRTMALAVLAPVAAFITIRAKNDSGVFNRDTYRLLFLRLLGLREKRSLAMREVILHDPDYATDVERIKGVSEKVTAYAHTKRLMLAPNVINVFFRFAPDNVIEEIRDELESVIDDLINTRDKQLINIMRTYPMMRVHAHTRPFNKRWMNIVAFCILPLGAFLYIRMWRFRLQLLRDLRVIKKTNEAVVERVTRLYLS